MQTIGRTILISCLILASLGTAFAVSPRSDVDLSANATKEMSEEDRLFQESLLQFYPLKGEQKREVLKEEIYQQEQERLPLPPGALQTKSAALSLKPGATIVSVTLRPNYPTTLVFLDATGQPWPIHEALSGNTEWVEVFVSKQAPGNLLTVIPKTYAGNVGLLTVLQPSTPVNLQLIIDTNATPDQQITLRADSRGPNAQSPTMTMQNYPDSTDPVLMNFLYGIPPDGAKPVFTDNDTVEAYRDGTTLLVRSPHQILWPSYQTIIQSGDGESTMYAYRMPPAPSILLEQPSGEPVSLELFDLMEAPQRDQ